jgi:hypothetical protein
MTSCCVAGSHLTLTLISVVIFFAFSPSCSSSSSVYSLFVFFTIPNRKSMPHEKRLGGRLVGRADAGGTLWKTNNKRKVTSNY